jgi:integrase/recombinase XerD
LSVIVEGERDGGSQNPSFHRFLLGDPKSTKTGLFWGAVCPYSRPQVQDLPSVSTNAVFTVPAAPASTLSSDDALVLAWLGGKSPHTRRAYSRIAEDFRAWVHPRGLREARITELQSFIEIKAHSGRSTRALRASVLKSIYSFGTRAGYFAANLGAFLTGVKTESKLAERYLTEEEVLRMIALSSDRPRDLAVLKLLYSAGLRVSELVALKWQDLQEREEGEAQLRIWGKGSKERFVRISSGTHEALRALRRTGAYEFEYLFASDYGARRVLSDRCIRELILSAARRAGIAKKVSPHWLRHAHASHALDRGAPVHLVQATLGHASVATTGRYLHARPRESSSRFLGI